MKYKNKTLCGLSFGTDECVRYMCVLFVVSHFSAVLAVDINNSKIDISLNFFFLRFI